MHLVPTEGSVGKRASHYGAKPRAARRRETLPAWPLRRAFRAGLPRGWHAVLPIILPAGEFPCWCRWRACPVVALRDGGLALLLDWACARLWTLFLEAGALCQSELQVEGAMTIYRSLLRSREGWRLRHGPAAAEVAFSLTHSLTHSIM